MRRAAAGGKVFAVCAAVAIVGAVSALGCGSRTELFASEAEGVDASTRADVGVPFEARAPEASAHDALPDLALPVDVFPGDSPVPPPPPGCDGGAVCGSVCTDLQTDPLNCGTCGHGCCGGACTQGQCVSGVLASGQAGPIGVAVDRSNVYWTNEGNGAPGSLMSVPLQGGTPTLLLQGTGSLIALAIDSAQAYTIDDGVGVKTVPLQGGPVTTLAAGPYRTGLGGLAVGGGSLYWTDADSVAVLAINLASGALSTIATVTEPSTQLGGIALGGQSVYFTASRTVGTAGFLYEVSAGGAGAPLTTLVSGLVGPFDVAVGPTDVFFDDSVTGDIDSVPLGGGPVQVLEGMQGTPEALVIDATDVYWTTQGIVAAKPQTGGSTTYDIVSTLTSQSPVGLAVREGCVYWTTPTTGTVSVLAWQP